MDAQTISPTERLKQIDEERKDLRIQVRDEREQKLEEAAKMRETRDIHIGIVNEKVNQVLALIFTYKKLGKVKKLDFKVLDKISNEITTIPQADN